MSDNPLKLKKRFRGFLPVVVDVETAGFHAEKDALLEIAAVMLKMNEEGIFERAETHACHVKPFEGANLEREALEFNKIDPYHPFRFALEEKEALERIFNPIHAALKNHECQMAVLVGHNPTFDLNFMQAATNRVRTKMPFHKFTTFDTATLGGLAYGQTVLVKACQAAKIPFDLNEAHSAIYDAEKTADLFCNILNKWKY